MNPQNTSMQPGMPIYLFDPNVVMQQNNELRTINQQLNQQLQQLHNEIVALRT